MSFPLPDWKPVALPARKPMQGRFCRLEPLEQRHATRLWSQFADAPQIWQFLPDGPFADAAEFEEWLLGRARQADSILFAICDARGEEALGIAGYFRLDPQNGSIEVGYLAFSPRLQRTAAATEALFLMAEHIFSLGYRRYEWKCNALNEASRRAALRLGFVFEGTFRQAAVVKGRNRDTSWFSMLDQEWPAHRSAFLAWLAPDNFDGRGQQKRSLADCRARHGDDGDDEPADS